MHVRNGYRLLLFLLLLLASRGVVAQEICDDGKDDDGDGLADLQDPSCQCHFEVTGNLLRNGSFETFDHCPSNYTFDVDSRLVTGWQYGTYTNGYEAEYYYNFSCASDSERVMLYMPPALPLPDGQAFVAIRQSVYRKPDYTETDIAKTYMSQCLPEPLRPGTSYTLSFNAGRFQSNDDSAFIYKLEPITVAVFGHADCNAAPFGQPYANSNGCPANYNGWTMLGKTTLRSKGAWAQGKINFTVPHDINVLAIGPDCTKIIPSTELSDSTTVLDYYVYYLDDVHLLPTEAFPFSYIEPASGNVCVQDSMLKAPALANAAYQWYKDSIAVVGATGRTYQVPPSERNGTYNVRISRGGGCAVSEPFSMQPNNLARLQIPPDTVLCSNDSVQLAPPLEGVTYRWNSQRTANVVVRQPGVYTITAEAGLCSKTMTVNVQATNCSTIYMPNAFTPNGDGRNDVFRIPVQTNLKVQQFFIYDRWGQVVFRTVTGSTGWDGTCNGKACAPGAYVYFIKGSFNNKEQIVKGVVSLIR